MYCRRALLWGLGLALVAAFLNLLCSSPFIIDLDGVLAFTVIGFGVGYLVGLMLQELIERKWI